MSQQAAVLSLVLPSLPAVNGLRVFETQCTIPAETTSYVTSPPTRGTLDIVWTCLATIFACVYTVLHLNIPRQQRPGEGSLMWNLKTTLERSKWAVIAVFVPEVILAKYAVDLSTARHYLRRLHRNVPESVENGWTLAHMLYAGMGGFTAKYRSTWQDAVNHGPVMSLELVQLASRDNVKPKAQPRDQIMPVLSRESARSQSIGERAECKTWHFGCGDIVHAIEAGLMPSTPPITLSELQDKSKSGDVAKILAACQVCYAVVSTIVRAAQHLPVSQLELATCAYVPFAVAIYACALYKPKGVMSPTVALTIDALPEGLTQARQSRLRHTCIAGAFGDSIDPGNNISNGDYETTQADDQGLITFGLPALLIIVSGAIHLAAWNFPFPSHVDAMLWRVAAIAVTSLPLWFAGLKAVVLLCAEYMGHPDVDASVVIIHLTTVPTFFIFLASRAIIIVEMFRCLAYLPPDAYVGTWLLNLPHIG